MIIREIEIKAFGKLENRTFVFGEGMNLVQGENETGKTTLQAFIKAMLFGMERGRGRASREDEYTRYRPWKNPGNYGGRMDLDIAGRSFRLIRDFSSDGRNLSAYDLRSGSECPDFAGEVLEPAGLNEGNYRNAMLAVPGSLPSSKELADRLGDKIIHMASGGDQELAASKAVSYLDARHKKLGKSKTEARLAELTELKKKFLAWEEEAERLRLEYEEIWERIQELERMLRTTEGEGKDGLSSGVIYFLAAMGSLILSAGLNQIVLLPVAAAVGILLFFVVVFVREGRKRSKHEMAQKYRLEKEELQEEKGKITIQMELVEKQLDSEEAVESELAELQMRWRGQKEEIEVLGIAAEVLRKVSRQIKSGFGDRFQASLCEAMREITDGIHGRLYMDEDFQIRLGEGEQIQSLDRFSKGTVEQLYLALRLSAGKLLFTESMPFLLDDALVHYDSSRIMKALIYLNREHRGQVILCSCTDREAECLEESGIPYRYVTLKEPLME